MREDRVRTDTAFLENSLIVAAHPDDEMLWFNAIVGRVDKVVIVYTDFWAVPAIGNRRRAAIGDLPLRNVTCLDIPEAGTHGCANWAQPVIDPYGLKFGPEESRRELTRLVKRSAGTVLQRQMNHSPARVAEHYRENYGRIREALRPQLRPGMNVFTHNPWGEYGHEDHVQIFRILDELRDEIGFTLWISNYCTERALPLAMRYFTDGRRPYVRLPSDIALARQIAAVYQKHDCWTWPSDWEFFPEECYQEAPRGEGAPPEAFRRPPPLNFFTIDDQARSLQRPLTIGAMALSALAGAALMEAL